MWDSIFVLIHHFDKPFKKKDVHYLINSRLNNPQKRKNAIIISHDIKLNDKCNDCKGFQPWIMLKNTGEGLFLLKKFIEKCEPWITAYLQENLYDFNFRSHEKFDGIFSLITKINSRKKLYDLIEEYKDNIINLDIRLKNQCSKCEALLLPWIIIKNKINGVELAKELHEKFRPYIILKKQKTIYKHNIPKNIKDLEKWTWKEEKRFGKLKIEI